jgi:Protein of unknown function (DUF2934)
MPEGFFDASHRRLNMTAGKQELPLRSRTLPESGIAGIKSATKSAAKANRAAITKGGSGLGAESGIDKEERRQLIAEAAYYRYQNRDYGMGSDVDDWLAAEEEIDRMLDF